MTPLDCDEIAFIQELIDNRPPQYCEAMHVIKDYEKYFSPPRKYGASFKMAVLCGDLKNIKFIGMDAGSKHLIYALHGGPQ